VPNERPVLVALEVVAVASAMAGLVLLSADEPALWR
jgi:hypothetical protein